MSLPTAGMVGLPLSRMPCSISRNDSAGGSAAAFTRTIPAISGWCSASHNVSVPPIDRPPTTTLSQRSASSVYAASALADQSAQDVSSMSSMAVPWPGSRGSSIAKPAPAKAWARPRIDCGQPVKPWSTRAPCGPPGAEKGSASGSTGYSGIGVLRREGLGPPVLGRGRRLRVLVDAVDWADGHALAAARAQLRNDDHIDAVIEDGAELVGAVTDAGVAVDAFRHLDAQRGQLPLRVAFPELDPLLTRGGGHRGDGTRRYAAASVPADVRTRWRRKWPTSTRS